MVLVDEGADAPQTVVGQGSRNPDLARATASLDGVLAQPASRPDPVQSTTGAQIPEESPAVS